MRLIAKTIRITSKVIEIIRAYILIIHYHYKYPGCNLSGSKLGRRISIVCTDGSKLILRNCEISDGVTIVAKHGGDIVIEDCFIGKNCVIVAHEKINIGCNSLISEMVVLRDHNHRFTDRTRLIEEQGFNVEPVNIGANCWIGAKATILGGSNIGKSVVVGAHSLVRGDIPENSLAVGCPAKVVRDL